MRIYRYRVGRAVYYGELVAEDTLARCVRLGAEKFELKRAGVEDTLGEVEILPPVAPGKIIGVGFNYRAHAAGMGVTPPEDKPLLFLKPPSSLIPHNGVIVLPEGSGQVEYAGEIALVIGERCRGVAAAEAYKYLLGVTAFNDVTAMDWLREDDQWTRAKGCDTFGPCGPYIDTSAAEALRVGGDRRVPLTVTTRLNGKQVQHGNVHDLAFNFASLISYASRYMTLEAGDLIVTGTPAGGGALNPGDEVAVELNCGPLLANTVAAWDDPALDLPTNGSG